GARVEIEHEWAEHYQTGRNNPSALVCTRCPAVKDLQPTAFEQSAKKQTSSAGRWWGRSVIYGKEDEHATPYMTRYWIGRLRLHIFHRGDRDPDCHDHPWDFWTFPFTPYVEEVALPCGGFYEKVKQIVPAWRLTFRPATHCHRVLGRYVGPKPRRDLDLYAEGRNLRAEELYVTRPVVTLVWRSADKRKWGFLKHRDGRWCWVHW